MSQTPSLSGATRGNPTRGIRTRRSFEAFTWLFMRLSGVMLLALIGGHLYSNLIAGEGIHQVDFAFVAGKWASPFWQIWDLLMLWFAMIHGANGIRTIINDYADRAGTRLTLKTLLATATTIVVILGTLIIFTFDPCPRASGDLPAFCSAHEISAQ